MDHTADERMSYILRHCQTVQIPECPGLWLAVQLTHRRPGVLESLDAAIDAEQRDAIAKVEPTAPRSPQCSATN